MTTKIYTNQMFSLSQNKNLPVLRIMDQEYLNPAIRRYYNRIENARVSFLHLFTDQQKIFRLQKSDYIPEINSSNDRMSISLINGVACGHYHVQLN